MKDLLKPGRDLAEYIDPDTGELFRHCITCLHRSQSKDFGWGGWICSSDELHDECNPDFKDPSHNLWEARVEGLIKEEDFSV